jgi:hypothetical protein
MDFYVLEDGRNVQTTFEALGEQTKVTTIFDAEKNEFGRSAKTGLASHFESV